MPFTPRSERTRTAILDAARRRFANDGYERATIRAIAADAAIDPSMVMRYYGSKEGLFAAAADVDLLLPDISGAAREKTGEILVRHFIERWEGGLSDEVLLVLFRAAITNESATQRLRDVFGEQVARTMAAVIPDPAEVQIRAGLIATQILGVALCRYILRLPPVADLDIGTLVANISPTVQRYLTGPIERDHD
ncbi:MAG TPA: TetR family transcriptional regulator [Thermopolyspora sp.]